ncbi:hypothetical protein PENSPDRAFT_759041 [Peniophora sp. CONT]|nr:hypothetical protein PENSPDRAFT_759041 [Peniophora sp. CONT]
MSVTSSRSSSFEYEEQLDSAAPPCRPWKYLEHPDAEEWTRGPLEVHQYPNLGDFVKAAKQIPERKYVALCFQTTGLPIHTKPTHPFDFLFVRQGRPEPRLPGIDTEDSCFAVLPNDTVVLDRPPVCPAHPLPWNDCYLDVTFGFPYGCRVTSTDRDYVPVLPMLDDEAMRVQQSLQDYWSPLIAERRNRGENWPPALDLVTLPVLPASDAPQDECTKELAPTRPAGHSLEPPPPTLSEMDVEQVVDKHSDEISIIESDDGSQHEHAPAAPEPGDDEELDTFLAFESMMNDEGELRDPVVNVWYDLDMIMEIVDPIHFLEDVKRLGCIIDEAEIRLGLRHNPAAAERNSLRPSAHEDTISERSTASSAKLAASRDNASSPRKDIIAKPAKGLRNRFGSATSRMLSCARTLVRKLVFIRLQKDSKSRL